MDHLKIDRYHYTAMIGVGGVGSGSFFKLKGNQTLGREESRSGVFLDQEDHCKLHIISHYIKSLSGPGFSVIPIGKVGDDEWGARLLKEMADVGMNTCCMEQSTGDRTLFSFCFLYPDGSGGNMTTSDSACSKVDAQYVERAMDKFIQYKGKGIALAVPEAPMEARIRLLELATDFDFFRIASFTSEEIPGILSSDLLTNIDLLAINLDEAAALTQLSVENDHPSNIVKEAVKRVSGVNPGIKLSVTLGKNGSWTWSNQSLHHVPVVEVSAINTAGAGDAFLAGIIIGLGAGLSFREAHELGSLTGSFSVTTTHTIHKKMSRESMRELGSDLIYPNSEMVHKLLEE
jgi:ribokinase